MDYLQPQGFLGTGASLIADLSLLAYILLIVPGMIVGYVFARQGKHRPHHQYAMIIVTVINWLLIFFLMIVAYRFDVIANITEQPGNARYLMPTIHGILGLVAQVLATYIIYRMFREDSQVARAKARGESKEQLRKYWFLNAKPFMRVTLLLWLATSLLGIFNYLIRYEVLPTFGAGSVVPVVTEEAVPAATVEAIATLDSLSVDPIITPEPATTPEPAVTIEADDDDGGSDNSGSGSSNSGSNDDDDD